VGTFLWRTAPTIWQENRLDRKNLTVTWRQSRRVDSGDDKLVLSSFVSLLRRQRSLEKLVFRIEQNLPSEIPFSKFSGHVTHTVMAGSCIPDEDSMNKIAQMIHQPPLHVISVLRSNLEKLSIPVLPNLSSLHVEPAPPTALWETSEPFSGDPFFSAPLSSPSTSSPSLAKIITAHILGCFLNARGGPCRTPSLRTLRLHTRDLLDDDGLDFLTAEFEMQGRKEQKGCPDYSSCHLSPYLSPPLMACKPRIESSEDSLRPLQLAALVLDAPRAGRGRPLSRFLLSGPFHALHHLTLRHVNCLSTAAIQRFLTESSALRLETLTLHRSEGQLAWADPVAEALALPSVAPRLRILETAFLPFSAKAAEALISRRICNYPASPNAPASSFPCDTSPDVQDAPDPTSFSASAPLHVSPAPMTSLRLWAAGLNYGDMCKLLGVPSSEPVIPPSLGLSASHLQDLRVLCLNFHRSDALLFALPAALAAGAAPGLEELILVHCRLDDRFALTLASVLEAGDPHGAASAIVSSSGQLLEYNAFSSDGDPSEAANAYPLRKGASCARTMRVLDLAYNRLEAAGFKALLNFAALSPTCVLERLRLDGNPLGGIQGVLAWSQSFLSSPNAAKASLRRLETLELRRVRLWETSDIFLAQNDVLSVVQTFMHPEKAPALRRLVFGVEATRGMNVEGQDARGTGGYLPPGTLARIWALLVTYKRRREDDLCENGTKEITSTTSRMLEVTAEGGSPFMGLEN